MAPLLHIDLPLSETTDSLLIGSSSNNLRETISCTHSTFHLCGGRVDYQQITTSTRITRTTIVSIRGTASLLLNGSNKVQSRQVCGTPIRTTEDTSNSSISSISSPMCSSLREILTRSLSHNPLFCRHYSRVPSPIKLLSAIRRSHGQTRSMSSYLQLSSVTQGQLISPMARTQSQQQNCRYIQDRQRGLAHTFLTVLRRMRKRPKQLQQLRKHGQET